MNMSSISERTIGLVFGKFYPLHCGHIYLIEKAVSQVDELHVILGYEEARDLKLFENSRMSKQPQLKDRLNWLQETFKNRHNIHIHTLDEAGIASYPNGWRDWAERTKALLQKHQVMPTVIFTSEPQDIANYNVHFGCEAKLIDADREFINISATKIRQNPYQNWQFIAKAARPFFVKYIAIIDDLPFNYLPKQLANIYNTEYVCNGFINYLSHKTQHKPKPCLNESDYIRIALLHCDRIELAAFTANRIVFTSIDFQTLHRLYQNRFKQTDPVLQEFADKFPFDLVISKTDLKQAIDLVEKLLS